MATETNNFDAIFCAAIEIESAQERAAYLAQVCAQDNELRQRLERLVAAHFRAGNFLEAPAVGEAQVEPPPREAPGTLIGPYKLLEEIGAGGFGVVFMAEQQEPIRRIVALKILHKRWLNDEEFKQRFLIEASHPERSEVEPVKKYVRFGASPRGAQALVLGRAGRGPDGRMIGEFRLWDVYSGRQLAAQRFVAENPEIADHKHAKLIVRSGVAAHHAGDTGDHGQRESEHDGAERRAQ